MGIGALEWNTLMAFASAIGRLGLMQASNYQSIPQLSNASYPPYHNTSHYIQKKNGDYNSKI